MPSFTLLSGRAKETISSNLLLVSIIYWLRSNFLEHPPPPPSLNFRPSLDLEKGWVRPKFVKLRVVAFSSRTLAEPCVIEATSVQLLRFSLLCFLSSILNVCYGPQVLYEITQPSSQYCQILTKRVKFLNGLLEKQALKN